MYIQAVAAFKQASIFSQHRFGIDNVDEDYYSPRDSKKLTVGLAPTDKKQEKDGDHPYKRMHSKKY